MSVRDETKVEPIVGIRTLLWYVMVYVHMLKKANMSTKVSIRAYTKEEPESLDDEQETKEIHTVKLPVKNPETETTAKGGAVRAAKRILYVVL